jgi:protein TonB
VAPDGRLTGCSAVRENPAGYGFSAAALALSTGFVMSLWGDDGLPTVGARVRAPVQYRLPPRRSDS